MIYCVYCRVGKDFNIILLPALTLTSEVIPGALVVLMISRKRVFRHVEKRIALMGSIGSFEADVVNKSTTGFP